ncbi:S9 family peptidase [Polymorphobacter fuscus]|uniref:Prolyl oligopeptidase family serine peptidase n=1 Tax=Sandarakinorhabdus fusca TaxID=1439888 RepID=A0A7C9KYU5_9SPHN|nr:S9 family peptidase [Polymorphobacter fuscus]KAB7646165.1 S9 family peptidase [Polymorphobacter fuscus]MQT17368.1 prolyl oligopeptidase family serine peptidase [Polymorphobacter fuscus]NJC10098.1 dipeptidyl aminopeptidase/acylaminoacyl peptidase [Polymorphobacter fuscus]
MKPHLLALLLAAATPAIAATPFEAADLYRLSMVTDPKVSPDGNHVVFTRAAFDIQSDTRTGELWLATVSGTKIDQRLLAGAATKAGGAEWSPDGKRIAYVAPFLGKPQLWVMDIATGTARMVTSGKVGPRGIAWSPDGSRIAFVGRVESPVVTIPGMPAKPEGATWATAPKVIDSFRYRNDGSGYIAPGAEQLFVTTLDGAAPVQLTKGDTDQISSTAIEWTPDGERIVYATRLRPGADMLPAESDLYSIAASGGAPVRLTDIDGSEEQPAVSPDGKMIAWVGAPTSTKFYIQPDLWIRPMAGGPARNLTARLDRPIIDAKWAKDGKGLYIFYNDAGFTRVARVSVNADTDKFGPMVIVEKVGGTRLYLPSSGGNWSEGNGTFAYTSAEADRPAALAIERQGHLVGKVDFNADWRASKSIGKLERVTWRSSVGALPIEGWVQYPPDFDPAKKYPLALEIHGGPNGDYGPYFSVTHQIYAAAGYIVLFSNPRGSIGYGEAFANGIDPSRGGSYPGDDHADLMSGVDEMVKRPYVDANNLFIGGGSGGGVLTTNAIAKTDRFRAAAALRPVTDWTVQGLTSDIVAVTLQNWVPGRPWDNHEDYWKRSTLSMVGSVKTPTLLIDGDADWRTPIAQTEAYYQALKVRGIDARMVRLPEAGHGMGRPSQWLASILAVTDWYGRYRAK